MEREISPLEEVVQHAGLGKHLAEQIQERAILQNNMNAIAGGVPVDLNDTQKVDEYLKAFGSETEDIALGIWTHERDSLFEGKDHDLAQKAILVKPHESVDGGSKRYEAHKRAYELNQLMQAYQEGKVDGKLIREELKKSVEASVEARFGPDNPRGKYVSKKTRDMYIAVSLASAERSEQIRSLYLQETYARAIQDFEGTFVENEGKEKAIATYVRKILEAEAGSEPDGKAALGVLQKIQALTARRDKG